jgi:hypothetical protein
MLQGLNIRRIFLSLEILKENFTETKQCDFILYILNEILNIIEIKNIFNPFSISLSLKGLTI